MALWISLSVSSLFVPGVAADGSRVGAFVGDSSTLRVACVTCRQLVIAGR